MNPDSQFGNPKRQKRKEREISNTRKKIGRFRIFADLFAFDMPSTVDWWLNDPPHDYNILCAVNKPVNQSIDRFFLHVFGITAARFFEVFFSSAWSLSSQSHPPLQLSFIDYRREMRPVIWKHLACVRFCSCAVHSYFSEGWSFDNELSVKILHMLRQPLLPHPHVPMRPQSQRADTYWWFKSIHIISKNWYCFVLTSICFFYSILVRVPFGY